MKIKINHFAFNEGASGYRNGCGPEMNPYYDENDNHTENSRQWKAGWKFEQSKQEAAK